MRTEDKYLIAAGVAVLASILCVVIHWVLIVVALAVAFYCVIKSEQGWYSDK